MILLGHIWTWSKGHTYEREYGSSLFHTIEKPKWVKVFIFLGTTDRQILERGDSVFYLPGASNGNSTLIIAEFLDGGDTKCGKKYWGDEGLTTTIASSGEMSEM